MTTRQMAVAVSVVSTGVAAVTWSGWSRRDGDLGLLTPALAAFAGHGLTHLLGSPCCGAAPPGW